jgi:hypothetical protein
MSVAAVNSQFPSIPYPSTEAPNNKTAKAEKNEPIEKEEPFEGLTKAIENKESIFIGEKGFWHKNSKIAALFRKIIGKSEPVLTAQQLAKYLSKPNIVNGEDFQGYAQRTDLPPAQIDRLVETVKNAMKSLIDQDKENLQQAKEDHVRLKQDQVDKRPGCLNEAELIYSDKAAFEKGNFEALSAFAELQQAQISSFYLGQTQEFINKTADNTEDFEWLKKQVAEWQDRSFPKEEKFLQGQNRKGTLEKLRRCCHYPKFIEAAKFNPLLLDLFFHAVLRNSAKNSTEPVDIFIQMPQIQKELHRCYLDTRIARMQNDGIKIKEFVDNKTGKITKDVTLLIDGKHQSITDPSKTVRIGERVQMSVKKLFEDTFKKGLDRGFIPYEYIQKTGVTEFDAACTNIDLKKKDWWKDVPQIQHLTWEQAYEDYKFGDAGFDCSVGKPIMIARFNRKNPDFHPKDTHSCFDILFPTPDGGFDRWTAGKFSTSFPSGILETLNHLTVPQPAKIVINDPNADYTYRQTRTFVFPPLNPERFSRLMEKIRKDLLRCAEGKEHFELQGENCTKWVDEVIKEVWDPYWSTGFFDTKFTEIIAPPPFNFCFQLGNWFRILLCVVVLGAWRGAEFLDDDGKKRTIRLMSHPGFLKGILRLPARACENDRAEQIRTAIAQLPKDPDVQGNKGKSLVQGITHHKKMLKETLAKERELNPQTIREESAITA